MPSQPDRDAAPHIVMGMHGRDYALQEPTDNHIVLATQRMRATYSDAANATTRYYTTLNATYLYGELTGQLRRQSLSQILIPNTCNAVTNSRVDSTGTELHEQSVLRF